MELLGMPVIESGDVGPVGDIRLEPLTNELAREFMEKYMAGKLATHEVLQWPEWKALAARLGITDELTRLIQIRLEAKQPVSVTVERMCRDHGDAHSS